jgi:hypothetical protein
MYHLDKNIKTVLTTYRENKHWNTNNNALILKTNEHRRVCRAFMRHKGPAGDNEQEIPFLDGISSP